MQTSKTSVRKMAGTLVCLLLLLAIRLYLWPFLVGKLPEGFLRRIWTCNSAFLVLDARRLLVLRMTAWIAVGMALLRIVLESRAIGGLFASLLPAGIPAALYCLFAQIQPNVKTVIAVGFALAAVGMIWSFHAFAHGVLHRERSIVLYGFRIGRYRKDSLENKLDRTACAIGLLMCSLMMYADLICLALWIAACRGWIP